jgi:hypothetical protein
LQGGECAKITAEFDRWNIDNPSINAIQEVDECNNVNSCNPTALLYIHLKPVGKPIFRIKVLADTHQPQHRRQARVQDQRDLH